MRPLFLEEHQPFLPPAAAAEVVALNRARLAYAAADFTAALRQLQHADYRDIVHLMNARSLQIKIYYESKEHEPCATSCALPALWSTAAANSAIIARSSAITCG
ncbi:MAG: hypothetical protein HC821_00170 [Lewinella sp.]|nr:hypothetical protein [Lewinella sp.]